MASENETPMWIDPKPKCRASCPRIKSANGSPFHIFFGSKLRRRVFSFLFFFFSSSFLVLSFLYLILLTACYCIYCVYGVSNVEDRLDWISSGWLASPWQLAHTCHPIQLNGGKEKCPVDVCTVCTVCMYCTYKDGEEK